MTGVLVHEWIAQDGGSENVLEAMSELFPDAPMICLWNDSVGRFTESRIQETWLARTPLRRSKALSLPFTAVTWRLLRDRGYQWALISSHAFAHHATFRGAPPTFRRMVYVHTPARYLWAPDLDERGNHLGVRVASGLLKPIDRRRANEGATFAANSHYVGQRIQDVWDVESRVIYPPVQVERIQLGGDWTSQLTAEEGDVIAGLPEGFVLGASRFVPYKQLEEVIRVGEATGRPVVLAGSGPCRQVLEAHARCSSVPVHFVDAPTNAMLYALYQRACVYVFPAVEDFGIMPVEAMAAGAPVLARSVGGAAESVLPGVTGALISFTDPDEMREGVEVAIATNRPDRQSRARDFSVARFQREVVSWVAGE